LKKNHLPQVKKGILEWNEYDNISLHISNAYSSKGHFIIVKNLIVNLHKLHKRNKKAQVHGKYPQETHELENASCTPDG
jgi:hypothetical protein